MDCSVVLPPTQSKAFSGGFPHVSLVTFLHLLFLFIPIRLDPDVLLQLLKIYDKIASVLLILNGEAHEKLDLPELNHTC